MFLINKYLTKVRFKFNIRYIIILTVLVFVSYNFLPIWSYKKNKPNCTKELFCLTATVSLSRMFLQGNARYTLWVKEVLSWLWEPEAGWKLLSIPRLVTQHGPGPLHSRHATPTIVCSISHSLSHLADSQYTCCKCNNLETDWETAKQSDCFIIFRTTVKKPNAKKDYW